MTAGDSGPDAAGLEGLSVAERLAIAFGTAPQPVDAVTSRPGADAVSRASEAEFPDGTDTDGR